MELNFGDVIAVLELRVPGLARRRATRHYGVPRKRSRVADVRPQQQHTCRTVRPEFGVIMDLKADQEVDVRTIWTDEPGNPAEAPPGATVTWETDAPDVVDVIDNGDGTAVIGATGQLGQAHVRVTVVVDGKPTVGEDVVNVVTGDAERVTVAFGEPRERTPDDEPTPEPADPPVV